MNRILIYPLTFLADQNSNILLITYFVYWFYSNNSYQQNRDIVFHLYPDKWLAENNKDKNIDDDNFLLD
jgi:hypothetical protein